MSPPMKLCSKTKVLGTNKPPLFLLRMEMDMAEELLSQALDTAWIVYTTNHREILAEDSRRCELARFLKSRIEAGETEIEDLALEGVAFLRKLEPSREHQLPGK